MHPSTQAHRIEHALDGLPKLLQGATRDSAASCSEMRTRICCTCTLTLPPIGTVSRTCEHMITCAEAVRDTGRNSTRLGVQTILGETMAKHMITCTEAVRDTGRNSTSLVVQTIIGETITTQVTRTGRSKECSIVTHLSP